MVTMVISNVSCKKILRTKIQELEKLNKIDRAICGKKKLTFIKNQEIHNFNSI